MRKIFSEAIGFFRNLFLCLRPPSPQEAVLEVVDLFFKASRIKIAFQSEPVPVIAPNGKMYGGGRASTLILFCGGRYWQFVNTTGAWRYMGFRESEDVRADAVMQHQEAQAAH